jgi:flagellar basal-body rod protein FlgB
MDLAATGAQLGNYLSYLTQRQEAISSNIANADTPGYKTRDVQVPSFSAALASLVRGPGVEASPEEITDLTARSDGNNVSLDREARLLAEVGLKFSVATQLARTDIKNLRSAIEEGRTG